MLSRAAFGILALGASASFLWPPAREVHRRLYSVSSAVVAPFAAHSLSRDFDDGVDVASHIRASPWFRDRKGEPSVPPTSARALPEPKLVLLLTIDAVRADVLSKPRRAKKLPALRSLKRHSAYFSEARAPASSTRPSTGAVFTGRHSSALRWGKRDGTTYLSDPGPRLAELLDQAGIATVSFPRLQRISAESGVGRGFREEIRRAFPAAKLVERIIERTRRLDGPTFLYAHFGEPHAPYEGKGTARQRYLQEVARVDRALARLVRHLDESGLADRTVLVLSSDHGEAFGEHGVGNHATIVYEEVARVPLLVRGPGVVARTIAEPVTLLDITPTILDLFGLPTPGTFMGQSLVPHLAGRDRPLTRPIAISSAGGLDALYVPGTTKKVILDRRRKTVELYDLARDPGERENLVDRPEPEVARAIAATRLFFDVHRRGGRRPAD